MKPPFPILLSVRSLGIGGCERDLTKLALTIDRTRFTPHVAYFREGFQLADLAQAGVPLLHLDVHAFLSRSALRGGRTLRAYLRDNGICVSHAYDVPLSLFSAPVARLAGVPVVITSALGSRSLYGQRERTLLKLSDRLSHRIVVNSEAMREELVREYATPPGKVFVCHNGYRPDVFSPPIDGTRSRPGGLEDAQIVVGSVCALRPEKNLGLLVRAFAQVRRPGVKLVIVGSGPEESRLKEEVRVNALEDAVVFEPATDRVSDWLRGIDIFVLPPTASRFQTQSLKQWRAAVR
jgi:glycosyltransferase involved in cell wall biosynthesis